MSTFPSIRHEPAFKIYESDMIDEIEAQLNHNKQPIIMLPSCKAEF